MAAKIWIGIKSRAAFLRRLSIVFSVELRLKIVTELYMREMSPKQFFEEFGGGTLSRVDKNFKRLEEGGWLRHVRTVTGGRRRGANEHFYRATELAYFDNDTWAMLPYSLRFAFSLNSFRQIAKRLREAIEAQAFESGRHQHLVCRQLLLDRQGWERVMEAVDAEFESAFEEQKDARCRVVQSGEDLCRANVVLIAFESPTVKGRRSAIHLEESDSEPLIPIPVRLSKVFADKVCLQIVEQANLREVSAKQLHAQFGGDSLSGISRRFRMLETIGWLKKVREETGGKRRGAVENFYRAAGPALDDEGDLCKDPPPSLKALDGWAPFEYLTGQARDAMRAGTFDAREDRYLAWSLVSLDEHGMAKTTASNEALLTLCLKEQGDTERRTKRSGETPVPMTVALAVFETSTEPKEP